MSETAAKPGLSAHRDNTGQEPAPYHIPEVGDADYQRPGLSHSVGLVDVPDSPVLTVGNEPARSHVMGPRQAAADPFAAGIDVDFQQGPEAGALVPGPTRNLPARDGRDGPDRVNKAGFGGVTIPDVPASARPVGPAPLAPKGDPVKPGPAAPAPLPAPAVKPA